MYCEEWMFAIEGQIYMVFMNKIIIKKLPLRIRTYSTLLLCPCNSYTVPRRPPMSNNTLHARQLFVGLESGVVEEFTLARDYNRLDSSRVYHAHDKVG